MSPARMGAELAALRAQLTAGDPPARLLPYAIGIVLEVFRAVLPPGTGTGTVIPADLANRLPYVVTRRVGGTALDVRFADRALIDYQTWDSSHQAAELLAEQCREALWRAAKTQAITSHGHIVAFSEQLAPTPLDAGEPDGVFRYQGSALLTVRI